jgi:hypothetical protein
MEDIMTAVGYIFLFIVSCCLLGLLFALPTMWLLNWLVPALIPGVASWSITWLQAWGVNILCNILFKGIRNRKDN